MNLQNDERDTTTRVNRERQTSWCFFGKSEKGNMRLNAPVWLKDERKNLVHVYINITTFFQYYTYALMSVVLVFVTSTLFLGGKGISFLQILLLRCELPVGDLVNVDMLMLDVNLTFICANVVIVLEHIFQKNRSSLWRSIERMCDREMALEGEKGTWTSSMVFDGMSKKGDADGVFWYIAAMIYIKRYA